MKGVDVAEANDEVRVGILGTYSQDYRVQLNLSYHQLNAKQRILLHKLWSMQD